jgi:hypothetical protein
MALSKTPVVALMAVVFTVVSLIGVAHAQAVEAPAPSPTSPAASVSPCLASAFLAAAVALVFGSARRF